MSENRPKKSKKRMAFEMGYAASLGLAMAVAIFGSLLFGVYLDRKFGTHNVFAALFFFIGVAAGFRNFYLFIKKYMGNSGDEDSDTGKKGNG